MGKKATNAMQSNILKMPKSRTLSPLHYLCIKDAILTSSFVLLMSAPHWEKRAHHLVEQEYWQSSHWMMVSQMASPGNYWRVDHSIHLVESTTCLMKFLLMAKQRKGAVSNDHLTTALSCRKELGAGCAVHGHSLATCSEFACSFPSFSYNWDKKKRL